MAISDILLAEDDTDDYNLFVDAFEKISPYYQLNRAGNGLECIRYLKREAKPDIIFLDLNMPYKNGLECLKFIKDNEELTSVPVIIYSTSHYIKDIDRAYKDGAHFYIIKPAEPEILTDVLNLVIERLAESNERPGKADFVVRVAATHNR